MSENKISRRKFLANAAALSSVLAVPSFIMGAGSSCSSPAPKKRDARIIGANGRVDMAMVGIGNRGKDVIKELDRIGVNTTKPAYAMLLPCVMLIWELNIHRK